jgi:tRNA (Thr-GGU) A37 N-methylase
MVVAIRLPPARFDHHELTAKRRESALATRAPHRPNPEGLSLALSGRTTVVNKGKRKQTCLVLRGLDLVDGASSYDVKPMGSNWMQCPQQ